MINKRVIVCGIVCRNNEVLLGKKAKGTPPYPDVWHTLGGGVKNFDKARFLLAKNDYNNKYFLNELERELVEEASVKIKNPVNICPKFRNKPREAETINKHGVNTHYIFLEYICDLDAVSNSSKPGDDIAELQWVKKSNLKKIKLTPPSIEMYKELGWL